MLELRDSGEKKTFFQKKWTNRLDHIRIKRMTRITKGRKRSEVVILLSSCCCTGRVP